MSFEGQGDAVGQDLLHQDAAPGRVALAQLAAVDHDETLGRFRIVNVDGEEEGRQTLLDLAGQAALLGGHRLLIARLFGGLATLPVLDLVLEGLDILTQIVGDAIRLGWDATTEPSLIPSGASPVSSIPAFSQRFILSRR